MKKFLRYIFTMIIMAALYITLLPQPSGTALAAGNTINIYFDSNGGHGKMDAVSTTEGTTITLPACKFTKIGYIFRGWTTERDSSKMEYEDQQDIRPSKSQTFYAIWEPQMYIIRFLGNGATGGSMDDIYATYDVKTGLPANRFVRTGYNFTGWADKSGRRYADKALVSDLDNGNTDSELLITVDSGKPANTKYTFRSTQGSCVYTEGEKTYLITAAIINDSAYNKGNTDHYETALTKFDIETGKIVRQVRNLPFDHGNSICYNEENGHLYIAEGGQVKGYPSGVMELDSNLKEVKEYNFDNLTNVWAITYHGGRYYIIGKSKTSRNTLCVLDENMNILSSTELDDYYNQFSSQGISCDGEFIYAVSAGFSSYHWKSRQRINVFDLTGNYIGVWTLDIPYEAEDITVIGNYAYITTNEHSKSSLYRARLPVCTLRAQWKADR